MCNSNEAVDYYTPCPVTVSTKLSDKSGYKESETKLFIPTYISDVQGGAIFSGSERKISEPSSNSNRICYSHFHH